MTSLRHDGRAIVDLGTRAIRLSVGGHRVEFLGWGFFEPTPWRNYLHTHSFFEICYAYAGSGVFRSGPDEHHLEPGMLFVARPGDVHEIEPTAEESLGICFWSYTLLPDRGSPGSGHQLLQSFAAPDAPVLSTSTEGIAALLELLVREAALRGAASDEVVSALTQSLVLETARAIVDDPDLAPDPDDRAVGRDELVVRTMTQYLLDNQERAVAVRDVAAQVHLSERHANRLFRAVTGTTIHAYLTRVRLESAAQRLLDRGASIKEVAHSCGYSDVRHFTTAFRQHWGRAPGAFRATNGTTHLARP